MGMSIPRTSAAAGRRLFLAAAAALLGASSCVLFPGSSGADTIKVTEDLSNKTHYDVDFSDADRVRLTLTGLSGKTLLLAKMNAGASSAIAGATGNAVLVSPPAPSSSSRSARSVGEADLPGGRPPRIPHKLAAEELSSSDSADSSASSRSASSRGTPLTEGATAQFWVDYTLYKDTLQERTYFSYITATLKEVTDHAYFWVADDSTTADGKASSTFDPTTPLFQTKIDLLADAFEAVVHPEVTSIYGYEYGGEPGGNGGVDGDQHISIFVYDIDFDGGTSSSYVAGYFRPYDEEAAATTINTANTTVSYASNGREIFYLDAWALEQYPWTIVSTLAHEYQHMINWNQVKYGTRKAASTWLNEFRSLAAEDLLAPAFSKFSETAYSGLDPYDFYLDGPGYWVSTFNGSYPGGGMEIWNYTLYDYAYASVVAAYLLRSYGGVQFMMDALANADNDMGAGLSFATAVSSAATRSGYADGTAPAPGAALSSIEDFYQDILGHFVNALWGIGADGTAGTSPLTQSDAVAASYNGESLTLNALSVKELSKSYSLHPGYAKYDGTFDYHYCDEIAGTSAILPYSFTLHTDDALVGLEQDTVELILDAPENGNVVYRFIVIE
jgi:hypothetical protein